ncbi:hypothetical protein D3H65_05550 [Paraflavitalea soli]|uniref:Tetratricopeptide repeat protein n=1 Tax=Paraflavitalea soli TaxID=2315862 RepID=A0A3B7MGI1_9BACT|nr:hypothetical protein [Paraflavitalea soli]AXY73472.1 hypothetical protein D3H65_05550 [Paraflavitalea soli]
MKHLAYIDDYFKGTDTGSHNRQFEQRLLDDPAFAEEVAFYLTTQRLLQEEARAEKVERFRKLYQQRPAPLQVVKSPRRLWQYVAAAAVIAGLIFSIYLLVPPSKQQMADSYIRQELKDLGVSMSGTIDSVDLMRTLYNKGKFADALTISEAIISHDATNQKALEYAGVTNLRLQQYDKALSWFKQLSANKAYSNKGTFYQALTLIKRNQAGDLTQAKSLLEQVVKEDLEGREIAKQWLEKW